MSVCLIALGSNLGDRRRTLDEAVARLARRPQLRVLAQSPWIETAAVGGPSGQGDFLNGAILLETSLPPEAVLAILQEIEAALGRRREERWGPRTIDLDLLLYDREVRRTPSLELPHPRMTQRRFVLEPAAAIAASMVHPLTGWTVQQHLDNLERMNLNAALQVFATVAELRAALAPLRRAGRKIGLVPTMGALHEGHLSLVRAAKAECDVVVATIYVNPSQFAATEDLAKYPRTLDADLAKLAQCGADFVFAPADAEVYRPGHAAWVEVGGAGEPLEGEFRPGHFRGVATIVLKLFQMVGPDAAYFGQKDCQQVAVVRRMVEDLNVPVEMRVCPTVREPDGLAMSSRNAYLSPAARRRAGVLWKSLQLAEELVRRGERNAAAILQQMRAVVETAGDARIDYIALVDPETFQPVQRIERRVLAALAVRIENTRLIDNCTLEPPAL